MKYVFVSSSFFNTTDEEILKIGKTFRGVPIAYGSNNYSKKVSRVNEIFSWINKDYPNIKEDDVEIRMLTANNTNFFANTLVLEFKITAEQFILLRNKNIRHIHIIN